MLSVYWFFSKLEPSASPQPSSLYHEKEGKVEDKHYSPKQTGLSLLVCKEVNLIDSCAPSAQIKALPTGSFHLPKTHIKGCAVDKQNTKPETER